VNARAYDAAGHMTSSAYVNITVANGAASTTGSTSTDTTAPVAHILKPWNGTWIGTAVPVSVSATDNVGVTSISVYVDGVLIATGNGASLYYYWDCSKLAHGTHKITATAKDKAGNAGSTSISVYH
jgi:thermitase